MTFVRQRQLVRLTFAEGHDLHGLEILTRRPNMRKMADLLGSLGELAGLANLAKVDATKATPEKLAQIASMGGKIEPMIGAFADALIEWNFELEALDEGGAPTPVAATREGLDELDMPDVMAMVSAWFRLVSPVAEGSDLGKDSPSGAIFPEGSLPMAPLSPSPLNLPVPA